jgi:drug/metabolite transporter (DMT)-like permease
MSGGILAILGALAFAVGGIATRRAVIRVLDATVGVLITVPLGVPFFLLILIATGQTASILSFSWQSYAWLSAAGIIHFIVGRSLSYSCTQLVGQNIANIVRRASPLVAVILGLSVLREPITWQLIVGVLLLIGGMTVAGLNPQMLRSGQKLFSGIPRKAILLGLGAGVAWGTTPLLIKFGLEGASSPIAAAFISYSAATIVLSFSLWNGNRRASLVGMKGGTMGLFSMVGLLASIAQLLRYIALGIAPMSVVSPLFSTSPIFQLILAFLFNRKLEVFNTPIIIGTIAVVIGTILLV